MKGALVQPDIFPALLLPEFPEHIDGLHRLAEVLEARGEKQKAAEYYWKTVEFVEQAEGFEKESVEFSKKRAEQLTEAMK